MDEMAIEAVGIIAVNVRVGFGMSKTVSFIVLPDGVSDIGITVGWGWNPLAVKGCGCRLA